MSEKIEIKSPLVKIVHQLKALDSVLNTESQVIPKKMVADLLEAVKKFAQELEHERRKAEVTIIQECVGMEAIKFQRGVIYAIRRLQRDWVKE